MDKTTLVSNGGRNGYVARLDSLSRLKWARGFEGPGWDEGSDITTDAAGRTMVAGYVTGAAMLKGTPTGGTAAHALLGAIPSDGQSLVATRYGGNGEQKATRVAARAAGELVVGGQFQVEIDLGQGPLRTDSSKSDFGHDIFLACVMP